MNQRDPRLNATAGLLVVGKDVPRTDAIPKVTGAAQYVADMHLPGHAARGGAAQPASARAHRLDRRQRRRRDARRQGGGDRRRHGAAQVGLLSVPTSIRSRSARCATSATKSRRSRRSTRRPRARPSIRSRSNTKCCPRCCRSMRRSRPARRWCTTMRPATSRIISRSSAATSTPAFKASDVIVEGTWESARQWHTALETIGCVAQLDRRPRHDVVQHADAVSRARPLCDRAGRAGSAGARDPDRSRRRLRRQVGRRQRIGDLRAARAQKPASR